MSNIGKYPYITLEQAKNYMIITSTNEDARLSNLITYACSAVENYIGQEILSNTYTETYDGGKSSIFVSRLPLQSVYTITENDGVAYRKLNNPQSDGSSINLSISNYDIQKFGSPTLKSRYKKFGDTSGFFDGSSYLQLSNSDDWYFGNSNFTIDVQLRANAFVNTQTIISQVEDSNNYWTLEYNTVNGITFRALAAGTEVANVTHAATTGYTANSFHHIEMVRSDSSLKLYRDGIQIATQTTSNTLPDLTSSLEIARQNNNPTYNYFTGFIDELRISQTARHTSAFTAPTYQHATDEYTVLLVHFDGTNNGDTFVDSHATTEDFIFYPDSGEITKNIGYGAGDNDLNIIGASTFRNYPRGVRVTYKAGYDAGNVPNDLIMATLDYLKMLHKNRQESQGFSLQGESVQERELSANFPKHIRRILDLYRIII